eukprot:2329143-Alexandrium_andersonii.AAC.1
MGRGTAPATSQSRTGPLRPATSANETPSRTHRGALAIPRPRLLATGGAQSPWWQARWGRACGGGLVNWDATPGRGRAFSSLSLL